MIFPCKLKDNVYNRHLAKGLIANNNKIKPEQYCLVTVNGLLQARKVVDIDKVILANPSIKVVE